MSGRAQKTHALLALSAAADVPWVRPDRTGGIFVEDHHRWALAAAVAAATVVPQVRPDRTGGIFDEAAAKL